MNKPLFEEFDEVSAKQWKQKIQFELDGADYNEELIYKSRDGINIKPFYHADDVGKTAKVPSPRNWEICEKIFVASAEKTNARAKKVLEKGAESLWLVIPSEEIEISTLFRNLPLNEITIYLSFQFFSENYFEKIRKYLLDKEHQVHLQLDIIGNLARTGNWYHNLEEDHRVLEKVVKSGNHFKSVLSVDSSLYQNSGATIPQELAYSLAHANEYINHFSKDKIENFTIQFVVAQGSNYFFEIAKLRALRLLYATIASAYNLPEKCLILALPTQRDKTLYDYNVNLLRTTTQSMSAILGGANTVYNLPYDAIYHKNNEFGDRIARNQLLVLKNESYLDKVSNAAEGSYYIESLTVQFAEKALQIFKEIENGGGFLKQLKEGIIQRKIEESAEQEQEMFDTGKISLIGTNKYSNPEDKMKGDLELYPFLKKNPRKTLIKPILEKRLAEKLEQERLEKEEKEANPQ